MEASEIRKMGDEVRGEDPGRAAELYRQASDLGDADASSSLGYMYIVGEGVPQDRVTAAEYLKRASDLGNTKAMCNLGSIMMGIDPSQALALFERAAESGYEKGMINAATMLRGGNGVAADPERAVMWLERAAAISTEAAGILAHILRTGEGVFPDKPRAAELYRKAAEAGDPDSQYDLAMMLDAGDGIPVDRVEAERWFRASADQGDNDARLCIGGILYERGEFSEAEGYFTDAALDGDVKAMYNLALMLMDGSLGERDENKAMEWMEMASDAGFVYAQSMLGSMLIDRDIGRAETLLRSASDAGEPTAMYNLGALALSGRIEMPDRDAIKLLTASAEAGICEARDLLMRLSSQGMLRSLVPDQQIIQAGDLVPAGQVLGHESVWTLDYGAVDTEGVRRSGIVVAVADEERPVTGDVEPRERERHRFWVGLVCVGVVPSHDCLGDVPEPLVLQAGYERRGILLRLLPWLVLIGMIGFVALSLKSCSASDEGQVRVGPMAPEAARTDRVEAQTSQEYRKNLARYSEDKAREALEKGESFVAPAADVRKKPVPVPVPAPEPRKDTSKPAVPADPRLSCGHKDPRAPGAACPCPERACPEKGGKG